MAAAPKWRVSSLASSSGKPSTASWRSTAKLSTSRRLVFCTSFFNLFVGVEPPGVFILPAVARHLSFLYSKWTFQLCKKNTDWYRCTAEELQTRLELIWNDLLQKAVARAVQNFCKRLQACVFKAGGHWTFYVTDFMLMCLRTRFPGSFLENHYCIRLKIFIANFETLVDKKCYHTLYTLKLNSKMVNMCIFVEYTCL